MDPRTRARPGQQIDLALDLDRVHIFDAASEKALDRIDLPEELQEVPAPGLVAAPA